ncbi:MAG: hypothetical protein IPJ41_18520 [Phycisphaerales bacterium]|nr:hypothetical protein [Phycisphaerales bacterium]
MARRMLLAVALGLATTLAVAVGFASRSVYGTWTPIYGGRLRNPVGGEGRGEFRANLFGARGVVVIEAFAREYEPDLSSMPPPETLIPDWAEGAVAPWIGGFEPWPEPEQTERRAARASGWPMVALWHEYDWRYDTALPAKGAYTTPGGLLLEPSVGNPGAWPIDYPRAIPLRPIWRGLLIDWSLFASAWLAMLTLVPFVRHRLRRKPGNCRGCGYDLSGLEAGTHCPECGSTPRRARVRRA